MNSLNNYYKYPKFTNKETPRITSTIKVISVNDMMQCHHILKVKDNSGEDIIVRDEIYSGRDYMISNI